MIKKRYIEVESPYYCINSNDYYRDVDGYWKLVNVCKDTGRICDGKTFPSWCPLKVMKE